MFHRESTVELPSELGGGELSVLAIHFTNQVLLQLRYNGELDTTYEVSRQGLGQLHQLGSNGELRDTMADYKAVSKLGNSDDAKLPVVCTQLAELVLRTVVDGIETFEPRNLLVTMSSKLWYHGSHDFETLMFVLRTIKQMYT